MRNSFLFTCFLLLLSVTTVCAEGYNYISAAELREQIETSAQLSILDIQFAGAYREAHFPAALATYAYPVKTAASRAQIDAKLSQLLDSGPVVIVSHRGGGGAMRAFDHLKSKRIDAARLFILQNGMQDWPYPELTESTEKPEG